MFSQRLQLGAIAVLLVSATACGFGGDSSKQKQWGEGGKKKSEPVTVVETDEVSTGSVADVLAASASVESEAMADIIPISTGIVVSLHRDEGDTVKKGDLLAVIDNVSLSAGAERAASDLRRLEEQYQEMERLASQGAVSDRELSDLRYQLEGARTSMREASRSHGQTRLTAPFDGVVAARDVRVGELATSSQAAFRVVDLHSLRVVAAMPERDLHRIAVGQSATLISAYDSTRTAKGEVERIAPVVDAGSGTFRVTVSVDPEQDVLRPGQFVTVDLEVDRREDVTVVPRKAIVYEDGSPVVYVYDTLTDEEIAKQKERAGKKADGSGSSRMPGWVAAMFGGSDGDEGEAEDDEDEAGHIARRTPLQLGLVDSTVAEVVSGLDVGQEVIVVGQSHLRDLARVRDVDEPVAEQEADAGDEGEEDKG